MYNPEGECYVKKNQTASLPNGRNAADHRRPRSAQRAILRTSDCSSRRASADSDRISHRRPLGGPDGELGASTRYLSQRFSMPNRAIAGMLTDVGTEEMAHVEMISAIIYQLTRNLSPEEIKRHGFDAYFVDHTTGIFPQAASGTPFTTAYIGVKGDVLADLHEDLAADAAIPYVQRGYEQISQDTATYITSHAPTGATPKPRI